MILGIPLFWTSICSSIDLSGLLGSWDDYNFHKFGNIYTWILSTCDLAKLYYEQHSQMIGESFIIVISEAENLVKSIIWYPLCVNPSEFNKLQNLRVWTLVIIDMEF